MKLTIRWRDVVASPEVLDHVKHAVAASVRPCASGVAWMRVSLLGEPGAPEPWVRCRIEVALRGGALRVVEAASSDALIAVDAAADRVAYVVEPPTLRARRAMARAA